MVKVRFFAKRRKRKGAKGLLICLMYLKKEFKIVITILIRKKLEREVTNMIKELVISIILVILIFIGDALTQGYLDKSVEDMSNELEELKEIIKIEEVDNKSAREKINNVHNNWDEKYEKLAYYIEHTELEKVETSLTGVRSYIESQEYSEGIAELDKSVYLLEHIKFKGKVSLKNIF